MAWGLIEPHGLGDYFPRGKYVGWDEKLEEQFLRITPAEEVSKLRQIGDVAYRYQAVVMMAGPAVRKFTSDQGSLEPYEWPPEYSTVKSHSNLSSLIMLRDQLLAVDEKLKALVERFEPGVHQFSPIKISMPRGREYPVPYFGMIIRRFIDSFVPEESLFEKRSEETDCYFGGRNKKEYARLAFSRSAIGNAHLWRERKLFRPEILISDTLKAAIAEEGLRIFRHYPVKVV